MYLILPKVFRLKWVEGNFFIRKIVYLALKKYQYIFAGFTNLQAIIFACLFRTMQSTVNMLDGVFQQPLAHLSAKNKHETMQSVL